ncbi:regulatory protein RecX [Bacteroides propionicifaciens]|jgi:regulatory protein|uniref:regulatory protein RecX n=1 Tax=Bacteroides propionicifaciens TaxID=392838 RepID=UPI00037BED18|nr:regulatory protein RecX [Bacteroides propionicifaciens]
MNNTNTKEALNSMAAYCAAAERCRSDIEKKLSKWELEIDEIESIISRLEKENFLNEERYARAYTNDKYKYAKWGKKKIAQGLYFKKVNDQLIENALKSIDYELYIENLKSILTHKAKTVKANSDYEKNGKLARFALGRGYEYGDISKVLPDIEEQY